MGIEIISICVEIFKTFFLVVVFFAPILIHYCTQAPAPWYLSGKFEFGKLIVFSLKKFLSGTENDYIPTKCVIWGSLRVCEKGELGVRIYQELGCWVLYIL